MINHCLQKSQIRVSSINKILIKLWISKFYNKLKNKQSKLQKKATTKVPPWNYLSLKVLIYVQIGEIMLPEKVFPEKKTLL